MAEREQQDDEPAPPAPPPPREAATRADARAVARAPLASLKSLTLLGEGSFSAVELVALPSPRSGGCHVSGGRSAALKRIKVRRQQQPHHPPPPRLTPPPHDATTTTTGSGGGPAAAPTPRTADAMLRSEREAHARAGGCGFVAHAFGLKQGRSAAAEEGAAAEAAAAGPVASPHAPPRRPANPHHQDLALLLEYHPGGDLAALLARRRAEHAVAAAATSAAAAAAAAALAPPLPPPHLTEPEARFVAACALVALETLHGARVIHRDLKPANLFVARSGFVVLGDLGCAAVLPGLAAAPPPSPSAALPPPSSPSRSSCVYRGKHCSAVSGTRAYMAPEIAALKKTKATRAAAGEDNAASADDGDENKKEYGAAADLFSLGASLYELASGELPPRQPSSSSSFPLAPGHRLSPELASLLLALTARDPQARPTALQAQAHAWFDGFDWPGLRARTMAAPPALAEAGASRGGGGG
jgi:serine/threonine protein kinase